MLRETSSPSDFESHDMDGRFSEAEKLEIITKSPVCLDEGLAGFARVRLPFGIEASFFIEKSDTEPILFLDTINLQDQELYGHGIGTRLCKAATRYALNVETELREARSANARLGALNMAIALFGEENVAAMKDTEGERYGWLGTKPLASMLDDFPPEHNQPYFIRNIYVSIDPEQVAAWEMPHIS